MTDGQMMWAVFGLLLACWVTAWLLWRNVRHRWEWRSLTRRARPEPWPFDWAVSCPELSRPCAWRVVERRR